MRAKIPRSYSKAALVCESDRGTLLLVGILDLGSTSRVTLERAWIRGVDAGAPPAPGYPATTTPAPPHGPWWDEEGTV